MLRKVFLGPILGAVCLILGTANAWAVNCSALPFTLTEGTTAFATQVMANFNALLSCANAALGTFSGPASSVDGAAVCFNGTTGQLGKACGTLGSVNGGTATPSATSSTTAVMMGLGTAWTCTPNRSGNVMVMISGTITNSVGSNSSFFIKYGTGAAPANGAAATGASGTSQVTLTAVSTNGVPFSLQAVATGLTLGVAVWFDLAFFSNSAGATQATNLNVSCLEV